MPGIAMWICGVEYKLGSFFVLYKPSADPRLFTEKSPFFIALGCHLCDAARKKWSLGIQLYILKILYIFYGLSVNFTSPLCF